MEKKKSLVNGRNNEQRKEDAAKRRELFLLAIEEWGNVKKACEITGIAKDTYGTWTQTDPEFSKRMDIARRAFGEALELLAYDRVKNPDKGRGSDVLLLGLLNANMPWKYRPQFAMNEDGGKELIFEWRKAAKEMANAAPKKDGELPSGVEDTLTEILEKRGRSAKQDTDI